MKFYSVDYWEKDLGPMRAHFKSASDAMKFAKELAANPDYSCMPVEVSLHRFKPVLSNILSALDAASNLGNCGYTGYPGDTNVYWSSEWKQRKTEPVSLTPDHSC